MPLELDGVSYNLEEIPQLQYICTSCSNKEKPHGFQMGQYLSSTQQSNKNKQNYLAKQLSGTRPCVQKNKTKFAGLVYFPKAQKIG